MWRSIPEHKLAQIAYAVYQQIDIILLDDEGVGSETVQDGNRAWAVIKILVKEGRVAVRDIPEKELTALAGATDCPYMLLERFFMILAEEVHEEVEQERATQQARGT